MQKSVFVKKIHTYFLTYSFITSRLDTSCIVPVSDSHGIKNPVLIQTISKHKKKDL